MAINVRLSNPEAYQVSRYLKFPDGQPITAMDLRAGNGELMNQLTAQHSGPKYLYGAEQYMYDASRAAETFYKMSNAPYDGESKITDSSFSLAIIDPKINKAIVEDVLSSFDGFTEPNFEYEERMRLQAYESQKHLLDLGDDGLTEAEVTNRKLAFEDKLKEAIKERRLAYRKGLREQEKQMASYRDDHMLLAKTSKKLMPGGILVFVTPKELIDQTVTMRLASQFEDIRVFRLPSEAYTDKRKCIIIAKKRRKNNADYRKEGFRLAEYKLMPYMEIPVIGDYLFDNGQHIEYRVPSQKPEAVINFRIGAFTAGEAQVIMRKSPLLGNYQKNYTQVMTTDEPISPTPLHKGHIMLLLTSGFLNGYIGKGANQHLVKGTAIKSSREVAETDDEGYMTVREREFYNISVKYLNANGEFKKLM